MFEDWICYAEDDGQGGGTPPPETPPDPPPDEGGPPETIPYERFKSVNDELKTMRAQMAKLQAAQKTAQEKELAEQQKWQQLAEQREAELKTERLKLTRLEIASKKGIPAEMAGRLQGDTPEDMEADADSLLQFLKPKDGPGVPPAGRGSGPKPLDLNTMTPEEIRKNKVKVWRQEISG